MNYRSTHAVDVLLENVTPGCRIIDVGSGLGGPARHIASNSPNTKVVALELQEDCHLKATEYTRRCGLADAVEHRCGNVLDESLEFEGGLFDVVASWLVFLHINEKEKLFGRLRGLLRPGGGLHLEDFYVKKPLTDSDRVLLSEDVYCDVLQTREDYISTVTSAGFCNVAFTDMTQDWTEFVTERRKGYENDREETLELHGEATYESQLHFFKSMETLFRGGRLGGVRLTAQACMTA
jgi:cyclopropane fatty-acyl-phospholipid synthase-like methyltransferase